MNDIIKIKGHDIVNKQTKSRISLGKIIDFLFNATLFTGCLAPGILLVSVIFGGLMGIILAVGIEFFLSLLFPLPDIVVSIIDWVFIGGTIICVFLYQLIGSLDVIIDKPVNINHREHTHRLTPTVFEAGASWFIEHSFIPKHKVLHALYRLVAL